MSERIALLALTRAGAALASRLREHLDGAAVHGLAHRVPQADQTFSDTTSHIAELYRAGTAVVGICASGILIRAVAELVCSKSHEPPLVAMSEDGRVVVPLLGGHQGANSLAARLAALSGGIAAVTTSSELRYGLALDEPPAGWTLANPEGHKAFVAALLAGEHCRLQGEAPWLQQSRLPWSHDARLTVAVTERLRGSDANTLVYHPATLALGVGCERGVDAAELIDLVDTVLSAHQLSPLSVAGVFSLDVKADELALHALADHLSVPARFFCASALEAERERLANPSPTVFAAVGCHGVAEGAALAAVGPEGTLAVPKTKSARATCAIARAPEPIDPRARGRPRGRLCVLGLGPGAAESTTPAVAAALREAEHLVGYSGYLKMVHTATHQTLHAFALGEETQRVDAALSLAAKGHSVALVCSGDPGIYAMASLVFERVERSADSAVGRIAITVLPGVSAMHAAAARAGAPLGHDFCAISLSDLLTPWSQIERRLEAAAQGDFVIALYNPASRQRRRQLARAVSLIEAVRGPDVPVVVARQVDRPKEAVEIVNLGCLNQAAVDMHTVLIIGSSHSKTILAGGRAQVYTPRGYGNQQPRESAT